MRAKYQVHKGKGLLQALGHRLLLGHAAAHGNNQPWLLLFYMLQSPYIAEHPVFRMFPYRAGVE